VNTGKGGVVAIDLFCGVGGLTRGLLNAGIDVAAGIDCDESCRFAYENNNHARFISEDITSLNPDVLLREYHNATVRILVGCAPCQPFSCLTQKQNQSESSKWHLLSYFGRLIRIIQPEIVSMENVPQLVSKQPFIDFLKTLVELGYNVNYSVVRCEDYGIPQTRRRLVLLASKYGHISLNAPNSGCKASTVRDAIGDLEPISSGCASKNDSLHRCQNMTEVNLKRIRNSRQGGTWLDWPDDLRSPCHKKKSGSTYGSVYARAVWDKPGPTITTQFFNFGSGRFGHPEQDRGLSLREGAILQTFPHDYEFFADGDSPSITKLARHIGNAVPVKLGEVIGQSIIDHLSAVNQNR